MFQPWRAKRVRVDVDWCRPYVAPPVLMPLALLVGATLVVSILDADRWLSFPFYDAARDEWPLKDDPFFQTINRYGPLPGLVFGIGGLVVAGLGAARARWRLVHVCGLHLGLVLLLGPGLVVNGGFKKLWGRPRPMQIVDFGGQDDFTPPWRPYRTHVDRHSFPSGHASMGFLLLAPAVFLRRHRPRVARGFLCGGLLAGCGLGAVRIAVGAHFLTDVLWSAGFVYLVAVGVDGGLHSWLGRPTEDGALCDRPHDEQQATDAAAESRRAA